MKEPQEPLWKKFQKQDFISFRKSIAGYTNKRVDGTLISPFHQHCETIGACYVDLKGYICVRDPALMARQEELYENCRRYDVATGDKPKVMQPTMV